MAGIDFHHQPFDAPPTYGHGPFAAMPAFHNEPDHPPPQAPPSIVGDPTFDILEWHPAYQSCQRFFLDHAQHEPATQALCALINIRLPFQSLTNPITSSTPGQQPAPTASSSTSSFTFAFPHPSAGNANLLPNRSRASSTQPPPTFVSLIPYIRRLVVTGFDKAAILHGFFGDDYTRGALPHVDCERRNYLFAAKHGGWRSCKKQYDLGSGMGGADESVPFMKPLDEAKMEELQAAEKAWSGWLAMEDWMVGPRAPEDGEEMRGREYGGQEQRGREFGEHVQASGSGGYGEHSWANGNRGQDMSNGAVESVE